MFNRDKGENAEYLTRAEATEAVASCTRMIESLDQRLNALEELARQLRRGSAMAAEAQVSAAPSVQSDALTRTEAQSALRELERVGAAEFRQTRNQISELSEHLDRKVNDAVAKVVEQARWTRTAMSDDGDVRTAPGIDYGAVAFGLSEIAAKVRGHLGGPQELVDHYREAVQYFADVFAKADATFNEAEFKRQAGV